MTKQELFESRAHAMACAILSNADQRERSEYWLTDKMIEAAIENVQAVVGALAKNPAHRRPRAAGQAMKGWSLLINGAPRAIWPADYHSATIAARLHREAGFTVSIVSPGGIIQPQPAPEEAKP